MCVKLYLRVLISFESLFVCLFVCVFVCVCMHVSVCMCVYLVFTSVDMCRRVYASVCSQVLYMHARMH